MREQQLCHWLLYQPNGKCHSAFAKQNDSLEGYYRVGPVAVSPQFVFPVVFAMLPSQATEPTPKDRSIRLQFEFYKDERSAPASAFRDMPQLKVMTLISELTNAIAHWVDEVGAQFESLALIDDASGRLELVFDASDGSAPSTLRCLELVKAGIEMMGYSRGLVAGNWFICASADHADE